MSQSLNIVRPNVSNAFGSLSTAPINVTIQSPALFQLLEFALRSEEGNRVIGTLLGTRSDDGSELDIKDAYIVPHHEEGDEVTIEEYHHRSLYQLHKRSNPKDSVLGWFSTNSTVDSFTALVHDFYSRSADGTFPHPAVHLTLSNENDGEITSIPTINTYIASPVGASGATAANLKLDKSSSYLFTPINNKLAFDIAENSVLSYASSAVFEQEDSQTIPLDNSSVDLKQLVDHLNKIDLLIGSTLKYIEQIEKKEIKGDEEFAKFLLTNLKTNLNSINLEQLEKSFNHHIQDTLMIEYLASSVKAQLELSAKLTTLI
ncbi:hypothetical protein BN7_4581 [Wickerhamomyces ciferrii]|uniref:MPN domain-containing protein n=1 Tax=Wickerhamomyces ciferrii (strain ATCC 14091 / BCRC 22168 / CBS 111 / JCM 3599 / NBRC 0793 / NRRL Y-1031 F-60-10) TaxID=1206466 RepID=K0KSI1_WICCF|nr:uncharacterized protein BN7_4581 [Wickerhamomyces ciferrii]CCH45002.1 hypothetical protein BN7_4581 [Wickerhamomyces ciferrii]